MRALMERVLESTDMESNEERSMLDDLVIVFKVSEHRKKKDNVKEFDGTISPYWEGLFDEMFRGW